MKLLSLLLLILTVNVNPSYADELANDITVVGSYTPKDGRVSDRTFNIEIKLHKKGTFSGKMDSWIGLYLSNGKESLRFNKQKLQGTWKIENNLLILKDFNNLLPKSAQLRSSNGMEVVNVK